jgi:hypothetical protein
MADTYLCPVCGFSGLRQPPWSNDSASDEICRSCGTHFGYDDTAGGNPAAREAIYRQRRDEWITAGMTWWSSVEPPAGWDPEAQLRSVTE